MIVQLLSILATTSAVANHVAAQNDSAVVCCFRRGHVNLSHCSHQAWWTVYTLRLPPPLLLSDDAAPSTPSTSPSSRPASPAIEGAWTEHTGVNCGGPRVHGPDPFSGSTSLADCKAACLSDPECHAIVVPTPGIPNPKPPAPCPTLKPPAPPSPTGPALPGRADVCADLDPQHRCSPEICDLQPHSTVRLEAKTYYQNTSIQIPEGTQVIGAGINKTIIVACGAPSSGRRGFILGNHSYLGHYTWQGLQAKRSNFDAAVGTPGCLSTDGCNGGCIPPDGDCVGVENATAEHIHVRPYARGDAWWPLSSSAGWFPHTRPWGAAGYTGSRNITVRGLISWGTWADGINLHGGHHNFLIEQCEMNFPGDDPFGLWPVSVDVKANRSTNCQTNIVIRNNVGRWPRQHSGMGHLENGGRSARDFPECDCGDAPPAQRNAHHNAFGCYSHACFGTYAGGRGVQFLNNSCEGAGLFLQLNGGFPADEGPNATVDTKWCGPIAVAGNTVRAMPRQGSGCMRNNLTDCAHTTNRSVAVARTCTNWCNKLPPPWSGIYPQAPTIGGQCSHTEPLLPPPCDHGPRFAACRAQPG
eukprot:COSAG01_NODE_9010_length_2583_cov_3.615539_1_plen_584_part_00